MTNELLCALYSTNKTPLVRRAFLISLDDRNNVKFLCSLNICFQINWEGVKNARDIKMSNRKHNKKAHDMKMRFCSVAFLQGNITRVPLKNVRLWGGRGKKNIAMSINYSIPNFNADKCCPIDLHVSLAKWKSHVNPLCLEKIYFIKPL